MPMELPRRSFFQMHLACGEIRANGKIAHDLLSHPPSIEKSLMRIRQAPFQVRNDSIIGSLRTQIVWILEVNLRIGDPTWSKH